LFVRGVYQLFNRVLSTKAANQRFRQIAGLSPEVPTYPQTYPQISTILRRELTSGSSVKECSGKGSRSGVGLLIPFLAVAKYLYRVVAKNETTHAHDAFCRKDRYVPEEA
jgi:hypothetical protein